MPEWVTALEAAVLTGASEIVVLDAVRSGRIQANPLSMGKKSSGVLLVRLRDVQALVDEARPVPPAPAPALPPAVVPAEAPAAVANQQAPGNEWLESSDIWNELTDTGEDFAPAEPAAAEPAAPPQMPTASPPAAFAPFSTPVTPVVPASAPVTPPPAIAPVSPPAPEPTVAPPTSAPPLAPVPVAAPPIAAPPTQPPATAPPVAAPPAAPLPTAPPAPSPSVPAAALAPAPPAAAPVTTLPATTQPVAPAVAPAPAASPPPALSVVAPAPAQSAPSPSVAPTSIWGERPAAPKPDPAIPVAVEAQRPRLRNPKTLAAAILALALLAAAVYVARPDGGGRDHPRVAGSLGPAPPSVVWMIPTSKGNQVAVVGLPASGPAVAIAVPSESHVILPAGDISTVGVSADSGPHAQAVAQNVLLKRIGHYLVTTPASFAKLVDALGGIRVQTEGTFTFGGHRINPGSIEMKGSMAVAYLSQAGETDVSGRWEDLLAGVLDAAKDSAAWGTVGESDDPVVVSRLLSASTGAPVYEMPTEPASGGGIEANRDALSTMLSKFGTSLGSLVRVVVVNGSGAPGLGTLIDGRLAPAGFSVVTSENASRFNVSRTVVVASGEGNLASADAAAKILGVKTVKVSDQPTSLADITIIVGKDLHP